jgi:uncharacterized iron-regulated membrane protein
MDVLNTHPPKLTAGANSKIAPQGADAPAAAAHRFVWRVHFWAGLVISPLLLFAALTGMLYVFTPQIEARLHASLDRVALPSGVDATSRDAVLQARLPLDSQLRAAMAVEPDLPVRSITPAFEPDATTRVVVSATRKKGAAEHHSAEPRVKQVYVNPFTGAIAGVIVEQDRFREWAKDLHSSALQGDGWRWLIELAASWTLVMLATGLYLWWPQPVRAGGRGWGAFVPRKQKEASSQSRLVWRDWHAVVAIVFAALTLIILATGLTWSKYAGQNFRNALNATGQSSPKPPTTLAAERAFADQPSLTAAAVQAIAEREVPRMALVLSPPDPNKPDAAWRVSTADPAAGSARAQLIINQYTGEVLWRSGWSEMPLLSKATVVGIPFHRGEFGWWNQLLLVLVAATLIFSIVSGAVMWWKRRPVGRVAAPPLTWAHIKEARVAVVLALAVGALLGWALPVLGISLAAMVFAEALWLGWQTWRHRGRLRSGTA